RTRGSDGALPARGHTVPRRVFRPRQPEWRGREGEDRDHARTPALMNEAVMVAAPERAGTKREVAAWCLYDFASSAFNTLMITFIFNRYYTDVIGGGTDRATFLWTLALNISAVTVAVAMPVLG